MRLEKRGKRARGRVWTGWPVALELTMALGPGRRRRDGGGMTGICPPWWANVSSSGSDVSSFRPDVSTFRPNVSTLAEEVSVKEVEKGEGRGARVGIAVWEALRGVTQVVYRHLRQVAGVWRLEVGKEGEGRLGRTGGTLRRDR